MILLKKIQLLSVCAALMMLGACDSPEEKSETHYQRGMELLEAGDVTKALLEFRNAIQLTPNAAKPHRELARIRLSEGKLQDAMGHYRIVLEAEPDDLDASIVVAQLLLDANAPAEAEWYVNTAIRVSPDAVDVRRLQARLHLANEQFDAAIDIARDLIAQDPSDTVTSLVLAAGLIETGKLDEALAVQETALTFAPEDFRLNRGYLATLERQAKTDAMIAHLQKMVTLYPDNAQVRQSLLQIHLRNGDQDAAVAVLKDMVVAFPEDPAHVQNLITLVLQAQGEAAARAEVNRLGEAKHHPVLLARILMEMDMAQGNVDAAAALIQTTLEGPITEAERLDLNTDLASIHYREGEAARALALLNDVLGVDPQNSRALQLRATIFIAQDDYDTAIADLRLALETAPRNSQIIMQIAGAYELSGAHELALERLAQAVKVSASGVEESLRYASVLLADGAADVALNVLQASIENHGTRPELLLGMARIRLQQSQWPAVIALVDQIEALSDREDLRLQASHLRVEALNGQQDYAQSIQFLQTFLEEVPDSGPALQSLVRTYILGGDLKTAEAVLDDTLKEEPNYLQANLLRGALHVFRAEPAEAEVKFRHAITTHPEAEAGYLALANLFLKQNKTSQADSIITEGLQNISFAPQLMLIKAGRLEQKGAFDAAIDIYQTLYDKNGGSDLLANNLASLMSEYRDDKESLDLAYTYARRLKNAKQPEFLDTYGWTLFRRGEFENALIPLQQAAEALPDNPIVLFHLGALYAQLDRHADAHVLLETAMGLTQNSEHSHFAKIRALLERLPAPQ